MLLAYPHSFGGNHGHHIRTPPRMSSPKLQSLSLAESSGSSSPMTSSLLIMDQQGEMHDPSYLSTLRSLHAEIGARASPRPGRRSSSAHAPSRPSHLGLGLSGRDVDTFYNKYANSSPYDDDSDSDDDDVDHDDNDDILPETSAKTFSSTSRSASGSNYLHTSTPPRTPPFSSPNTTSRPMSLSTPSHDEIKEKHRRASLAARLRDNNSRSSALIQHDAEARKSQEWGFTGLVDLERAQRAARVSFDEKENESSSAAQEKVVASSSSSWKAGSLLRKSSDSSSFVKGADRDPKNPFSRRLSQSGSNASFWSMSHNALKRPTSVTSLKESSPDTNNLSPDINNLGLTTIISGKPLSNAESNNSDQWSAISDPSSAREYANYHEKVEAQLKKQQQEADFIVGPSKYKQSKEVVKQKTLELSDASTQARKKVENVALGVRFGVFKARKRLERSFKE